MKYGISSVIGFEIGSKTRQNRFDVVIIHGKMSHLFTKLLNMDQSKLLIIWSILYGSLGSEVEGLKTERSQRLKVDGRVFIQIVKIDDMRKWMVWRSKNWRSLQHKLESLLKIWSESGRSFLTRIVIYTNGRPFLLDATYFKAHCPPLSRTVLPLSRGNDRPLRTCFSLGNCPSLRIFYFIIWIYSFMIIYLH